MKNWHLSLFFSSCMSVVPQPLRDNVNLTTLVMYTFPVVAAKRYSLQKGQIWIIMTPKDWLCRHDICQNFYATGVLSSTNLLHTLAFHDIWHFMTFDIWWHLTFHDIWHLMTFDITWHLTYHDIWHFMTFDISWHLIFHDIWHVMTFDVSWLLTFHDSWHFMTFLDI